MNQKPDFVRISEERANEIEKDYKKENNLSIEEIEEIINKNQLGDAEILQKHIKNQFVYDSLRGIYFRFNNGYWEKDIENEILKESSIYFFKFYSLLYSEVQKKLSFISKKEDDYKRLSKLLSKIVERRSAICTKTRLENVLKIASSGKSQENSIAISGNEWNSDPYALQANDTIINLHNGESRKGIPSDFISKSCPTEWRGVNEPCFEWMKFLRSTFNNDEKIIDYVQKILGVALIGKVLVNEYYILWGKGRNGKSVLLETLHSVLGSEICGPASSDLIMTNKTTNNHDVEILELQGKRLIWISETNDNQFVNPEFLKKATGGDTLHGFYKFSNNEISFQPTHTLFILTNHKPRIPATDDAVWRRTRLISFPMQFVENPQNENEAKQDIYLKDKLEKEKPGILAWLVNGCLKWQDEENHLPPESITDSVNTYRLEEDIVKQFINECCILGKFFESTTGNLYTAFCEWFKDQYGENSRILSNVKFSRRLEEEPGIKKIANKETGSRHTIFSGIGIKQL